MNVPRIPLVLLLSCLLLALPACGGGGGGDGAAPGGGGGGGGGGAGAPALGDPPVDTLIVTNHLDAGPGSLRQVIADAPSGSWIVFGALLAVNDVQLLSPLVIDKVLTIGGLGGGGVGRHGIDGQNATHHFNVVSGGALQLNDMVLHHGTGVISGSIVSQDAPLVLWRTRIHHCITPGGNGAAISMSGGSLMAYDCFFDWNDAGAAGGAIAAFETELRIERGSFHQNHADTNGGALALLACDATFVNCAMQGNTAMAGNGGAIHAKSQPFSPPCAVAIYNGTINDNASGSVAGGIYMWGDDGVEATLLLERSILADNNAPVDPDCSTQGVVTPTGTRNLVGIGSGVYWDGIGHNMVGNPVTPEDPMLLPPFALPDGRMVCLPQFASPVVDAVPIGENPNPEGVPMVVDLRLLPRPLAAATDIGAIEL